jgi:predicted TIM-barrel fold metal-dependent hydrolase
MTLTTITERSGRSGIEGLAIVDCDFHNDTVIAGPRYLPKRWQEYLEMAGRRHYEHYGVATQQRPSACRLDSFPPGGGMPGTDQDFVREQLLDKYDISTAVINNVAGGGQSGNSPVEFEIALARATNECNYAEWLADDPRYVASITVTADHPVAAAAEIERCRGLSDRFAQVMIGSRSERPHGNPKYWPIYEVASALDVPLGFHVSSNKYHNWSGVGPADFYYEMHTSFPLAAQANMASMIFEGIFDRWPNLKIVHVELGWEWAVPFAWRLDAAWRVLKSEVPHLQRKPSEYIRDHFWFSTQPAVEPEDPADFYSVWEQFEDFGLGDHLLFATDYPHWDFDSPFDAIPHLLSRADKRRILGANAAALYGLTIDLPE